MGQTVKLNVAAKVIKNYLLCKYFSLILNLFGDDEEVFLLSLLCEKVFSIKKVSFCDDMVSVR